MANGSLLRQFSHRCGFLKTMNVNAVNCYADTAHSTDVRLHAEKRLKFFYYWIKESKLVIPRFGSWASLLVFQISVFMRVANDRLKMLRN